MSATPDRPLANNYGFVGIGGGETQKAGLFVDDQDRILYWSGKSGPALMFDKDTGLRLIRSAQKLSGYVLAALLLSSSAFMLVTFFTHIFYYHHFAAWFSWPGLLFAVVVGIIVIPFIVWAVIWRLFVFGFLIKKWQRHSIGVLQSRRPDPILIDPNIGQYYQDHAIGWLFFALATVGFPIIAVFSAEKVGDQGALWLTSACMAFVMLRRFRKSPDWVSVLKIRTLIPLPEGLKAHLAQPPKTVSQIITNGLKEIGKKISSFLLLIIGLIVFLVVIAIVFHQVTKEKMPPEMLVEAYIQSVFPIDSSRVRAWTGPVTVCIGPSENGPRYDVVQRQESLWEASGLDVTFAETNCSVDIVFLTESRSANSEDNLPMGGKIHFAGDQLDRILIEISVKDYGYLEPGASFRDRHAVDAMERGIASTAGMWALGIPGRYEFDGTFTDHTGERVDGSALIAQMHYHPSIPHGATLNQVRPLLQGIAEEFLKYRAEDAQSKE